LAAAISKPAIVNRDPGSIKKGEGNLSKSPMGSVAERAGRKAGHTVLDGATAYEVFDTPAIGHRQPARNFASIPTHAQDV
jgi:hypothetical protein